MADLGGNVAGGGFMPLWTDEFGLKQSIAFDDAGNMTIKAEQDLSLVKDQLHDIREANDGYNAARDMKRVAHIPGVVLMHLQNQWGSHPLLPENRDRLVKWIMDPDNAAFRTATGRVALVNGEMR